MLALGCFRRAVHSATAQSHLLPARPHQLCPDDGPLSSCTCSNAISLLLHRQFVTTSIRFIRKLRRERRQSACCRILISLPLCSVSPHPESPAAAAAASGATYHRGPAHHDTLAQRQSRACYPTAVCVPAVWVVFKSICPSKQIADSHIHIHEQSTQLCALYAMKSSRRVIPRRGSSHSAEFEALTGPDMPTEMHASAILGDEYEGQGGGAFSWVDYGIFGFLGMAMLWAW